MGVLTGDGDMDRGLEALGQGAKEMRDELRWQAADGLAREFALEDSIGASGEVNRHAHLGFVHGQHEAITRNAELGAQCSAQRIAERQRTIFDGVVFVDLQVTLALELERKATVLGELLQHVIEEADAGGNGDGCGGIQTHGNLDVGFLRLAAELGLALGERAQDRRPGFRLVAVTADANAAHAEIGGEFEVGVTIPDHHAAGEVDVLFTHETFDQLDLGLAAVAAIGLAMRADEHGVELDTLRAEYVEHELVRSIEVGLRKARAAEAILVGDHHEAKAGRARLAHGIEHPGHEPELLYGINLLIGRFLDESAIAVDEQDSVLAHARLRTRRSFCSGLPTEMRRDCDDTLRMSRINSFTLRAAASASSGAAKSVSRKFATLGQIFRTDDRVASAAHSRSRSPRTCATRSRWMASCAGASVANTASMVSCGIE